jgi:hypothetical protein
MSKRANTQKRSSDQPQTPDLNLSDAERDILLRVMNGTTGLNDLLLSHGHFGDIVTAGLVNASGLADQIPASAKAAVYGFIKVGFLWGVRAAQEEWEKRYPDSGQGKGV